MKNGLLHHIEIYVSDLERSTHFWKWLLEYMGYEQFQKWDQGISFKLGDTYLVFVQTKEKFLDQPYHRCRTGLNHLAFHAESRLKVDELTTVLKGRGVPVLYEKQHAKTSKSSYAVYFEDPDRIKVEFVCR